MTDWKVFYEPSDSTEKSPKLNLLGIISAETFQQAEKQAIATYTPDDPDRIIVVRRTHRRRTTE